MSKREREGFLWILLAAAGFAFIPTIVKTVYSNSNFEPLDLALWRFIVAVPLMWLLVKIKDRSRELGGGRSINVRHTLIMGRDFCDRRDIRVLCAAATAGEHLYRLVLYLPGAGSRVFNVAW